MPVTIVEPSPPKKNRNFVGIAILLTIAVIVIGLFLYQTISTGQAALMVESSPSGIVYVDGEQKGRTPLEIEVEAKEVIVKIVPEGSTPLSPYETKVKLTEGVKTIVRRKFGESGASASGQIISFERSGSETSIAVVSTPDGVEVLLDGKTEGVTPLKVITTQGEHSLKLQSENYSEESLNVRAVSGYKVTAIVDLSMLPKPEESAGSTEEAEDTEEVLSEEDEEIEKIVILNTSVGYLRVRASASVSSEELGRVEPGEEFEVLEYDVAEDWYKIEYEEGLEGWVSGQYVATPP